jgi:hypothetical protein
MFVVVKALLRFQVLVSEHDMLFGKNDIYPGGDRGGEEEYD